MNSNHKQAAEQKAQGSSGQEFEQAFFQLAYDKLQNKLFNLLPFLVGFELVKKNDDNTKAVGVFGFKSANGQILFVPTFFTNGKVQDLDLVYSRNNNQFYPLNEDFAELFLKDDATGIGKPSDSRREEIQRDGSRINMKDVLYPPRQGRITYASAKEDHEFNEEISKTAAAMAEAVDSIAMPTLLEFVKAGGAEAQAALWSLIEKHANFADAVAHFYTNEELVDALTPKQAAVPMKESSKLKIHRFEDKSGDVSEDVAKALTSKGYSIEDGRPDTEVSPVGLFKYTETFSNPTTSGFYPYITQMGTLRYGVVLTKPQRLNNPFAFDKAVVIDLDAEKAGQAYYVDLKDVFVKDNVVLKDFADIQKKLLEEPAEVLPSYDTYLLVNDKLECSQPFKVLENFKDHAGIRRLRVRPMYEEDEPSRKDEPKDRTIVLVLTKRGGDRLDHRNQAVYVPNNFKLLKIETSEYCSIPCDESVSYDDRRKREEAERARIKLGRPGRLSHLTNFLAERNIFPLTVQTNGSEYFVSVNNAKTKYDNALECKIGMVTHIGLSEKRAEETLAALNLKHTLEGQIKVAYLGDEMLPVEDEQPYTNDLGQPTYVGAPYYNTAGTQDGYTGDPTQMGLGVKPDVDSVNQNVNDATTLAQSGQKEIFDTQSIATIAKYVNPNEKILGYIPNFVASLDKLGRMLFMIRWETEKFQDMYGKDEMPELIELVKNVFNNLGDLIIFMKRKVPDLSINTNEQAEEAL